MIFVLIFRILGQDKKISKQQIMMNDECSLLISQFIDNQ
jgi:hypothetical protein